jgi:hypothetical protein
MSDARPDDRAVNADKKQRGRPFQPGQSGNPAGKPLGARHKVTILAEKLMGDDAEAVIQAVITAAKGGDMVAARLVLERIAPLSRNRTVALDLPIGLSATDLAQATAAILQASAEGTISPDEGATLAGIVEVRRKARETVEFEQRLATLEARGGAS